MSHRARARRIQRLVRVVAAIGSGLAWCLIAAAQDQPIDTRITPQDCDKWEARTRALASSTDPVEQQLGELLQHPELRFCQTRLMPVSDLKPEEQSEPRWLPDLTTLASLLQWLAIAILIGMLSWLLMRLQPGRWRKRHDGRPGRLIPEDRTRNLLDPSHDELERVLEAAEQAWQAGDQRRAFSLLYRGAIVRIWPDEHDQRARTEREVLRALGQQRYPDQLLATMRSLTRLWQQSAWAHRMPSDADFRAIHDRWAQTFGDRAVQRS